MSPRRPSEYSRGPRVWVPADWRTDFFAEITGDKAIDFLRTHASACDALKLTLKANGRRRAISIGRPGRRWNQLFAPRSKQSPFEGGTRTPIILRWPGVIEPNRHDMLVSSVDLTPTLLGAAGLDPPAEMPGLDLLDAIVGGEPPLRDAIFGEAFAHDIADVDDPTASLLYRWVIEGRFKLLVRHDGALGRYAAVHAGGPGGSQLFDLLADPYETTSVAEQYPDVVEHLSWRIRHWWPAGL